MRRPRRTDHPFGVLSALRLDRRGSPTGGVQTHDPAADAFVGATAALHLAALRLTAGRIRKAIRWGERRVGSNAETGAHQVPESRVRYSLITMSPR
jgi:hypothetical protein